MTISEVVKERCSVRKYINKKVEEDKLRIILESARVAPTAANIQPVRLIVVQTQEGLEAVSKGANIYNAPLAIVACVDKSKAWKRPVDGMVTSDIDATILTDHMMLQATELGIGSVWICHFQPEIIKKELKIPNNLEPINILALGYSNQPRPDQNRHEEKRIAMEELVEYR